MYIHVAIEFEDDMKRGIVGQQTYFTKWYLCINCYFDRKKKV